jgi:DNA helicase-2/ATP-dependent DNA helicase PcrA
MSNYLEELSPVQRQAVTHVDGPVMIIAGAGSGKTRVLTYRIAYLMSRGVPPFNILALTFTNKAAAEMRERITKFTGSSHHIPFIGTFHSYCLYLLKRNSHLLPYDTFSIIIMIHFVSDWVKIIGLWLV